MAVWSGGELSISLQWCAHLQMNLVALLAWAALAGCDRPSQPRTQAIETPSGAAVVAMTDEMRFSPGELSIRRGESVVWVNRGELPHTTTNNPDLAAVPEHNILPLGAAAWDSGALRHGQRFQRVFEVPGRYVYSCSLHEVNGMIGILIVE